MEELFIEGVRKNLGESSRGNEYQKEIDNMKCLVGDQALVIDALKKSTREERMIAVNTLKKEMPIARISGALDVPRSSIYHSNNEISVNIKPRVYGSIETEIIRISEERTTYGYRRIWALMRNSGINVDIKTILRIVRRNILSLPYAWHKNFTKQGI